MVLRREYGPLKYSVLEPFRQTCSLCSSCVMSRHTCVWFLGARHAHIIGWIAFSKTRKVLRSIRYFISFNCLLSACVGFHGSTRAGGYARCSKKSTPLLLDRTHQIANCCQVINYIRKSKRLQYILLSETTYTVFI